MYNSEPKNKADMMEDILKNDFDRNYTDMDYMEFERAELRKKEQMKVWATKMGVDFIDLKSISVNKEAVNLLNKEIVMKYFIFPFDVKNNLLQLAMLTPDDIFMIDEIKMFAQIEVKPFLADGRLISQYIDLFYMDEESSKYEGDVSVSEIAGADGFYIGMDKEQLASRSQASDVKSGFFKELVLNALNAGAVNIHINTSKSSGKIRYRINKVLEKQYFDNDIGLDSLTNEIRNIAGFKANTDRIPQKAYISFELDKYQKAEMDILTLPLMEGEYILIKLKNGLLSYSFNNLGMDEYEKGIIQSVLRKKSGMVVITGMPGSGRTTTCYSILKELASDELNIITVEDRVIEKLSGINQIQVEALEQEYVETMLKSVIQLDADVLLVDTKVNAAMLEMLMSTGLKDKLIVVVMSFPSVFETICGIIDMGIQPFMLAYSIESIVSQVMEERACITCKEAEDAWNLWHDEDYPYDVKEPCSLCGGSGYTGKACRFDVFKMSSEYEKLIVRNENLDAIRAKIEDRRKNFI